MANHDDNSFLFDGKLIEVEKGSFITSELKLMNRWGWSKSKLRYFLFTLESQQMIVKNTDRKKTALTICKYCDYQISETTEKPQKDHRKTTERPLKDTNKNDKNVKNDKEDIYSKLHPSVHDPLFHYQKMRKQIKKQMSDRAVELLIGKLNKMAPSNYELQISMLEEATEKCWLSVYFPKNEKPSTNVLDEIIRKGMQDESDGYGKDYEVDTVTVQRLLQGR